MKLRTCIIDDEKHATETLSYDLRERFEEKVEIVFTSNNPVEGLKKIQAEKPDLVFLDIEMPGLSGIDILSLLDDMNLDVVITTAHQAFAIQTVGTKAIAYLLKPVFPEELENVIQLAIQSKQKRKAPKQDIKIAVPVFDGIELIDFNTIIYIKSDGNYSEIYCAENRKIVASKTLKHFEEMLPNGIFIRIHKSYLVHSGFIRKYLKRDGGEIVMSNNDVLPISRNRREEVIKLIQNNH